MGTKITFVTGNKHKFEEVSKLLETSVEGYEVIQSTKELSELQADSLEEVAKFKVNSVKTVIKPPYFIEDAGFFVDDVCKGFPGVYSSYVMKTIGYEGILKILGSTDQRKAHFESVIAYIDEYYQIRFFKGINEGAVELEARGKSGFGFDPIFISKDTPDRTFAELTMEEKNAISHRRRAMMKLIEFLNSKKNKSQSRSN
ncbi:dITP/XTP pyrophosphatase [Candidatus Lokiarchaeum ossiferum]|uniref:DITP/XTP pyrophosphatase n=1 Tax=Candidatus Lokiarchaeum ossiferum TaxID=2951803 RepID=A0ABY6HLS3_9ARCH|nr:dITP/XTP pyrophosphatase [Candidatus Lokiarchaeum sp. B-35]